MALKIETIVNGPFMENCFLAWDEDAMKGILVDPGSEAERLVRTAGFLNVEVEGIFNTHAHIDHAGAVAEIKKQLGVPFALHPEDEFLLAGLPDQARMFGLPPIAVPEVDRRLAEGDEIQVGGLTGTVIHTPGHTPGGVCFLFGDSVFVGDTLFAGSIGRTDLPGGSLPQIIASIKDKLLVLDDDVRAYSGHGPATTIGSERKYNPFLNGELV